MKLIRIFKYINDGSFFNRLYNKYGRVVFVKNKIILNKVNQYKLLKKIRKKYKYVVDSFIFDSSLEQKKVNIVWIFWYQGIENAPMIIKRCLESQKKYLNNYDIRIITKDNIDKFISLPDYIMSKFQKGVISFTHFSDILRISLLAQYGGIWLDSTVLLTDTLPSYITNSPLFVYKSIELDRCDESPVVASSWLISSYTNQEIIILTRDLIYEYWKNENKLMDYFLFHLCFKIATEAFTEQFESIPTYSNINPHILYFECLNDYNKERFEEIKKMSSVHKLNRSLTNEDKNKFTFLDYILDNISNG